MKTYRQWLDPRARAHDSRRCLVCGHRSLPPIRRSLNWLFVFLLGAALCYIALDIAEDGRLDGRLFHFLLGGAGVDVATSPTRLSAGCSRSTVCPSAP